MKTYLQSKGFKFVDNKDDLSSLEFTLTDQSETVNEELSTLGNLRFNTIQTWSIYLAKGIYTAEWVKNKFSDIYDNDVQEFEVLADKQEDNGYLITLTITLRGA